MRTAELLRPGLLEGVSMMLAHAGAAPAGQAAPAAAPLLGALDEGARALSASLGECRLPVDEEALAQRLREDGAPDLLVVDAAGAFTAATEGDPGARAPATRQPRPGEARWRAPCS